MDPECRSNFYNAKKNHHITGGHFYLYKCALLLPANEVCEGYVFTPVCQSFCSQGGSASVHAKIHTPFIPRADHPPPWSRPPLGADTPLRSACWEIRATSGRYASYWNAYFLVNRFGLKLSRQLRESHVLEIQEGKQ